MAEKITYNINLDDEKVIDLKKIKDTVFMNFKDISDNAKQKLVYNLLNALKGKNQDEFFWLLLRQINSPDFQGLSKRLNEDYGILTEETFINYGYSIILGIMSTYKNSIDKNE